MLPLSTIAGSKWPIFFNLVWSCSWQFHWYCFLKAIISDNQHDNYLINGGDNTKIKCLVGCTSYLVIGVKNCKLSSGMLTFNAIDVYHHLKGLEECICPDDRGNRFLWNVGTPTRLQCHIPGDINFVSRLSDIWWIEAWNNSFGIPKYTRPTKFFCCLFNFMCYDHPTESDDQW